MECYGGDASRLLDVCRARIAFDSVADLLACLETIVAADDSWVPQALPGPMPAAGPPGGVIVVRVRNGLSSAYKPADTAGYRVRTKPSLFCGIEGER